MSKLLFIVLSLQIVVLDVFFINSQNTTRTVTGRIMGQNGKPLPGYAVNYLDSTMIHAVTDVNGGFSLTVPNQENVYIKIKDACFSERYVKYSGREETFKQIVLYNSLTVRQWQLLEREDRRIFKEWTKQRFRKKS